MVVRGREEEEEEEEELETEDTCSLLCGGRCLDRCDQTLSTLVFLHRKEEVLRSSCFRGIGISHSSMALR